MSRYGMREHLLHPGKYFITQDGEAMPDHCKKPMRMLPLRVAQRRLEQLNRIQRMQRDFAAARYIK
jgi:hypothetical protein